MGCGGRLILGQADRFGVNRLTTVSQIHERSPHAYRATGRTDSERVFRSARRHSRFVRVLRVAIPVCVVGSIVAAIVATFVLDPLRALAKLPLDMGNLVVSGTKITMQQPRLAGFTHDARPYVVNARAATQDITQPDRLELEDIRATMESKDNGSFEVVAHSGVFETKADKLTLNRSIVVNSSTYRAHLTEAFINVRTGHVVSEKPVEVTMTQGTINANRLEMINSGEIIRFEQGVTMVLTDRAAATDQADTQ
jgi:lipopolysaccharide export system protein LptC